MASPDIATLITGALAIVAFLVIVARGETDKPGVADYVLLSSFFVSATGFLSGAFIHVMALV